MLPLNYIDERMDNKTEQIRKSFIKYLKFNLIDRIDNHTYIHGNTHDLACFVAGLGGIQLNEGINMNMFIGRIFRTLFVLARVI